MNRALNFNKNMQLLRHAGFAPHSCPKLCSCLSYMYRSHASLASMLSVLLRCYSCYVHRLGEYSDDNFDDDRVTGKDGPLSRFQDAIENIGDDLTDT